MLLVPGRGSDVLVDLINQSNSLPVPLTPDQVVFSTPRSYADLPGGTVVTLIPSIGSPYQGQVELIYQRINLTDSFKDTVPEVRGVSGTTLDTMLPAINERLGLDLKVEDFESITVNWLTAGGQVNLMLKARADSLSYLGGFTIRFVRLRPNLDDSIRVHRLDRFTHPSQITAPTRSVDLTTWGMDFTEDVLSGTLKTRTVLGYDWVSPTRVAALMAGEFGLAGWPKVDTTKPALQLMDKPTSQVPGANPKFQRVIVQPQVVGSDYAGTAYFHYNRA